MSRPKTKNVYLDTSVHVAAKFGYESGNLRRLKALAVGGLVRIFDTRVDEGEILSHIKTSAEHLASLLKRFQRDGAGLRDPKRPEFMTLFVDLEAKKVEQRLTKAYHDFRKEAAVSRIVLPQQTADRVLDLYFGTLAPFAGGQKKSEFPDAIIVTALRHWCSEADEAMYVITQDEGMAEAANCSGVLHALTRVDEFLTLIVSEEYEEIAILAHKWVAERRDVIVQKVTEQFSNAGFYLEDADGDVENIAIEDLRITEPLLVEVTDQHAVFTTRLRVDFQVDISYDDPSTGIYDSEDKVMFFMDRRHVRIRREDDFRAEISVRFSPPQPDRRVVDLEDAEIDRIEIQEGRDIAVSFEDEVVDVYPNSENQEEWFAELPTEKDASSQKSADDEEQGF